MPVFNKLFYTTKGLFTIYVYRFLLFFYHLPTPCLQSFTSDQPPTYCKHLHLRVDHAKKHNHVYRNLYSLRPKLWTMYCFMKQNCQLQSGIAQYENAATPLSSKAIHATHQYYQKRYLTLFQLKGLKGYQQLKFECLDFLSKTDFTFLLWPITFETLEIK